MTLLRLMPILLMTLLLASLASASPVPAPSPAPVSPLRILTRTSLNAQVLARTDNDAGYPYFPEDITSCGVCGKNYASLDSCIQAAPVFANVSAILFNPGAFIDVIKCACTETFQAVFPQCVDCFEKTNQTQYLEPQTSPTDVVNGPREVCGLASVLLGGVAKANSEEYVKPSTTAAPAPTGTSAAGREILARGGLTGLMVALLMLAL